MPERRLNLTREQQAMAELGRTDVSKPVQLLLTGVFLLMVFSVPFIQMIAEWSGRVPQDSEARGLAAVQALDVFKRAPSLDHFNRFENELDDRSIIGNYILPRMQPIMISLGVGNASTLIGHDGWLHFADDVLHLTGRAFLAPDVLLARARAGDLTQRQTQPDPIKAIIDFNDQLAARGITLVIVPTPLKPQIYPETLSHRYIPDDAPLRNPSFEAFRDGIMAGGVALFDPAPVLADIKRAGSIEPTYLRTDTHWTPAGMQAVAEAMVEYLTTIGLDLPDLAQPPAYRTQNLEHSSHGDIFHMLALPDGVDVGYKPETVTLRQVLTLAETETFIDDEDHQAPFEIEARIGDITHPPRPGTVAYRDAVVSLLLHDVRAIDGRAIDDELLIYALGMDDNNWTAFARFQAGEQIRLWIEPWTQVDDAYGSLQRLDITENMALILTLNEYWARLEAPDEADHDSQTDHYWRRDEHGDILLMGDSFSNIYSRPALGWGRSAGLAEQLSLLLGRPLDTIIIDGGGAMAGRRQLAGDMARGRDRLAGKRLVIWQFATRELSQGDWSLIALPPPSATD